MMWERASKWFCGLPLWAQIALSLLLAAVAGEIARLVER